MRRAVLALFAVFFALIAYGKLAGDRQADPHMFRHVETGRRSAVAAAVRACGRQSRKVGERWSSHR